MNKNFINGQWLDAESGNTYPVLNPATEGVITVVPFGDATDAHAAIDAAAAAFPTWKAMNAWNRADILKKAADLMRSRAKELGNYDCRSGKTDCRSGRGVGRCGAIF